MFENMSNRERNVAKRRAKAQLRQKNRENRIKLVTASQNTSSSLIDCLREDKDQPARKKVKMEAKGSSQEDTIPIEDIPKHSPFQEEVSFNFKSLNLIFFFYSGLIGLLNGFMNIFLIFSSILHGNQDTELV